MNCPQCAEIADKVIETRESKDGLYIRRRRECLHCGKRFTTYEKIEDIPLMVVKKDGRREPFDMDKIRKGLYRAMEKRPVQTKQIEQLARQVEEFFSRSDREVPTVKIGENDHGKTEETWTRWPMCVSPRSTWNSKAWRSS